MTLDGFLALFDRRTSLTLAVVSGLFSAILSVSMGILAVTHRTPVYFEAPTLVQAKADLRQDPNDEALIQSIREEDLLRREAYFRMRDRLRLGGYFLFGGLCVFVLSMRRLQALGEGLPEPVPVGELSPPP